MSHWILVDSKNSERLSRNCKIKFKLASINEKHDIEIKMLKNTIQTLAIKNKMLIAEGKTLEQNWFNAIELLSAQEDRIAQQDLLITQFISQQAPGLMDQWKIYSRSRLIVNLPDVYDVPLSSIYEIDSDIILSNDVNNSINK